MILNTDHNDQITDAINARYETKRPTVPAMEAILHVPVPLLDHGFIRVVDYMGGDDAVVQAARVSYGKGTTRVTDDRGLIRYLMRHRHSTPFEMAEVKLHCKMPIFVARQWIRHRTANVNEISGRYSILDKEFYVPSEADLGEQSKVNRQGRSDETLSADQAADVLRLITRASEEAYEAYDWLLNDDGAGAPRDPALPMLARELARMNLTLNYYTQWYWKVDLHNLLGFLSLRMDSHAQKEIRVYGDAIGDVVSRWCPHTWEAFQDYRFQGVHLSRMEFDAIKLALNGQKPDLDALGLSKREQRELADKFGI